jgi:alanine racemase
MAYIRIDTSHLFANLTTLSLKAGSKDKLAVVLKDNAYGHGLEIIAKSCAEFGITKAVVRTIAEAEAIEAFFDDILVLGDRAIAHPKLRFALNDFDAIAQAQNGARVDLKIDTGMHRNGIAPDQLLEALSLIRKRGLKLAGIMTHFRSADVLSSEYYWQKKRFEEIKAQARSAGYEAEFHSHNSAALLRCETFEEDFARVGIAMYGYNELPSLYDAPTLKPVMSLWAERIATRKLRKGDRLGYGGDFIAPRDMTVSTYDIGYGDGWCRGKSARPYVTSEGKAILGRVSMDAITLEGDAPEVCVFDNAQTAAKHFDTISYEITTALSPFLRRVVTE